MNFCDFIKLSTHFGCWDPIISKFLERNSRHIYRCHLKFSLTWCPHEFLRFYTKFHSLFKPAVQKFWNLTRWDDRYIQIVVNITFNLKTHVGFSQFFHSNISPPTPFLGDNVKTNRVLQGKSVEAEYRFTIIGWCVEKLPHTETYHKETDRQIPNGQFNRRTEYSHRSFVNNDLEVFIVVSIVTVTNTIITAGRNMTTWFSLIRDLH